MKRIFVLFVGIFILLKSSLGYSLTIKQPENNSVFYPGQKVNVVIEVAPNEDVVGMVVSATPEGSSGVILKTPYEIELIIGDRYIGKARIRALARLKDDTAVDAEVNITIQLPPDVKLEKIVTDKIVSIRKNAVGTSFSSKKLFVYGLFTDGIERDLNSIYTVQYASSDSSTVAIDNNGVITGLKLGGSTITISVGDKVESVDVDVFVIIDLDKELLVKPTETGIQLDWKLSPQDPEWVTGYMVFRTEDPDGVIKRKITDVPNGTTTYIDTTAVKGKTYYYGVQAISATANERSSMTNMTPGVLP